LELYFVTNRFTFWFNGFYFSHSDTLQATDSGIKELIAWLVNTFKISDYKVTVSTFASGAAINTKQYVITTSISTHAISEPVKLVEVLKNCVTWIVESKDIAVREKAKFLQEKEQEIGSLKRILLAFESSGHNSNSHNGENVVSTPVRGGGLFSSSSPELTHSSLHAYTPNAKSNGTSAGADTSVTPGGAAGTMTTSMVSATGTGTGAGTGAGAGTGVSSALRWSSASSVLTNVSPAAKQAAKLHSEVLKEVS
jgi:hypothetical protein